MSAARREQDTDKMGLSSCRDTYQSPHAVLSLHGVRIIQTGLYVQYGSHRTLLLGLYRPTVLGSGTAGESCCSPLQDEEEDDVAQGQHSGRHDDRRSTSTKNPTASQNDEDFDVSDTKISGQDEAMNSE